MNFYIKLSLFLILNVCITACNERVGKEKQAETMEEDSVKNGLQTSYYPDNKLLSECNYLNNRRHGNCKSYYKNGKVHVELNYVNGKREGEGKTFYEKSGNVYRISNYKNDILDGIQKVYHENGNLQAEIPYKMGKLLKGLKEYTTDGKLNDNTPKIVITEKDSRSVNGEFILFLNIKGTSKYKEVEFYTGELTDGNCFDENTLTRIPTQNETGRMFFKLPPNTFIMEKFNIIAKVKSNIGNYFIVTTSYNVAIQN
jgi:hypothetical protein